MLTERKIRIMNDVIRSYSKDAKPVGSQAIVERDHVAVSTATIRNDMQELEDDGYLSQPHTSAGRVPTEKAWKYFLDHLNTERKVGKTEQQELRTIMRDFHNEHHDMLKRFAQSIADFTQQAAFIAFTPHDTYYTGISKLFRQPEFDEVTLVRELSSVVDELDDHMPDFFNRLDGDVTILLGHDNPLSRHCGILLSRVPRRESLLGVLGPIRQDYEGNIALLKFTHELLETPHD